jgi:hypothetical protein
MFMAIEGEGRRHEQIRYARYRLTSEIPRDVKRAVRRVKLTGFDVPLPIPLTVLHFGIRTPKEYHHDFCGKMFYCPNTKRYYESGNFCPYCGLDFAKARADA